MKHKKEYRIKVLTTSPSLNAEKNVSGIASLTKLWVKKNVFVDYSVFTAGKEDEEKRNLKWIIKQPLVLISFISFLLFKRVSLCHINMPLEKAAIFRDSCFIFISYLICIPVILHLRGGYYSKKSETPILLKFLLKYSLKYSKKIIVLGEMEKKFYSKEYNILDEKIIVLPNCVEVISEFSEKKPALTSLNILYLGRLDKNKGLIEILKGLRNLGEIEYVFNYAGDGPDKDWFLETAKKMLGEKVNYHGVVYGSKKVELLLKSHIFLLPSYFEGLPNALLEAMSYGVVPIVTAVGSIPEVVKDGENGLFVEKHSFSEISESVKRLYSNPVFLMDLSVNSKATISRSYSIDNYLVTINSLYHNILYK